MNAVVTMKCVSFDGEGFREYDAETRDAVVVPARGMESVADGAWMALDGWCGRAKVCHIGMGDIGMGDISVQMRSVYGCDVPLHVASRLLGRECIRFKAELSDGEGHTFPMNVVRLYRLAPWERIERKDTRTLVNILAGMRQESVLTCLDTPYLHGRDAVIRKTVKEWLEDYGPGVFRIGGWRLRVIRVGAACRLPAIEHVVEGIMFVGDRTCEDGGKVGE